MKDRLLSIAASLGLAASAIAATGSGSAAIAAPAVSGVIACAPAQYQTTIAEFPDTTTKKSTTNPSTFGITPGPDGNLWFTDFDANAFGKVTPTGAVTLMSGQPTQPVPTGPAVITVGPDGNLWFTEENPDGRLFKVTPAGKVTTLTISPGNPPNPGEVPLGIASGPDGYLWFTDVHNSKIGKIKPDGTTGPIWYPLPQGAQGAQPKRIVAGPDKNSMYFTEFALHRIGRVDLNGGNYAEFPLSPGANPRDIIVGPDNNLWFTEYGTSKIGTLNPNLTGLREFSTPTPNSHPYGIANGPDGNLWFVEESGNAVGVVTPAASTIAEIASIPTPSSTPAEIVTGPDGNLWFTESNPNARKIGRLAYACPPGNYHPVTPFRLTDTRPSSTVGPRGVPLGPNSRFDVQVAGAGGGLIPSGGVQAVVLNVTATNTSAASFLTVFPAGQNPPTASNLNWTPGTTIPNLVTVGLGSGGAISVYNYAGNVDVVIDVEGYFDAGNNPTGGLMNPLTNPQRILDTRPSPLGPNSSIRLTVGGQPNIPAGASAAILNVTVDGTSAPSFLTVWPDGASRPTASNLNWVAGQTIPNRVIVPLGTGGAVDIYNYAGFANVIVDINGYFLDATQAGATGKQFVAAASPARILDTRPSSRVGALAGFGPNQAQNALIPVNASAVVMNTTVTNTTGSSFLTVWPPNQPQPTISDLNWKPGVTIPNLVVARIDSGYVSVYNYAGSTDVIMDVVGWFV